jgi:hypothetical protein
VRADLYGSFVMTQEYRARSRKKKEAEHTRDYQQDSYLMMAPLIVLHAGCSAAITSWITGCSLTP